MNAKCIISCAQGLGDWIIINPIIRMLSKTYKEVLVPYNYYSKDFIKNMFPDISNLSLHLNLENFEHHWLSNSEINSSFHCVGVKDSSTDFLKFLDKQKIALGSVVKIIDKEDFDDTLTVEIDGKRLTISNKIANNLYVQ